MRNCICFFVIYLLIVSEGVFGKEPIYAVMITGKDKYHKELAIRSIESFKRQTYKNKYLIIINDGKYSLQSSSNDRIQEIKIRRKANLGKLRNFGLKAVPAKALWIQWDDDDWHHENLIEEQYRILQQKNADAVVLKNQVQYSVKKAKPWLKIQDTGIEGTILARNYPDIGYRDRKFGEDCDYIRMYKQRYRVHVWDNPSYYYLRFIHGFNTWNEAHFEKVEKAKDAQKILKVDQQYLQKTLKKFYSHWKTR